MKNMNRFLEQNEQAESIARRAIMMGTDGSVQDPIATYSFVISISRTDVKTSVRGGGGFLPLTAAQYLDPYSKRPEAAALVLAGLIWIQKLLRKFPNHTDTNPPPLLIPPVNNNNGVVKDVLHRTINAQTPTYDLLSPDFDILLQAIRTSSTLNELPIRMDIAHV
jgi:hypothetical protein